MDYGKFMSDEFSRGQEHADRLEAAGAAAYASFGLHRQITSVATLLEVIETLRAGGLSYNRIAEHLTGQLGSAASEFSDAFDAGALERGF